MTEEKKDKRTVTFDFDGSITLKVSQVFVDDDPPEQFTADDVAAMIEGQYSSIGDFIDDWGLGDSVSCTITTSDHDTRDLNI